jgi:hypothetical protein
VVQEGVHTPSIAGVLNERNRTQTLRDLASLKVVPVPVPESTTASGFGMMANAEAAKESVPVYNRRFQFSDRVG